MKVVNSKGNISTANIEIIQKGLSVKRTINVGPTPVELPEGDAIYMINTFKDVKEVSAPASQRTILSAPALDKKPEKTATPAPVDETTIDTDFSPDLDKDKELDSDEKGSLETGKDKDTESDKKGFRGVRNAINSLRNKP
jgi:hypothetical protein